MVKNVGESSSDSGVSQKASAKQVKSSLVQFTKSGKRTKRKSKKRVTFSDDQTPERIPLWQRFVGFFHILWNCTRTSVQTALRKFSHSFFLNTPDVFLPSNPSTFYFLRAIFCARINCIIHGFCLKIQLVRYFLNLRATFSLLF